MAATAQEGQEPAGIRFLPTPHAHAEPGAVLKAGPRLFRSAAAFPPLRRCPAQQIFRLRKLGAVHSDQSGRDILRTALPQQASGTLPTGFLEFYWLHHHLNQTIIVTPPNVVRSRGSHPPDT